ncbi:hypothetical protein [Bradyrhizobium sp.]|uniref:hypothetical protein n=1 Tax=Bradyrhizobium sp. TaxID=376 RepID=UPI003C723A3A
MATVDSTERKQNCLDEALRGDEAIRADEYSDDEFSDGLVSLLEENARLRGLVVKLSDIILRHVADRR